MELGDQLKSVFVCDVTTCNPSRISVSVEAWENAKDVALDFGSSSSKNKRLVVILEATVGPVSKPSKESHNSLLRSKCTAAGI